MFCINIINIFFWFSEIRELCVLGQLNKYWRNLVTQYADNNEFDVTSKIFKLFDGKLVFLFGNCIVNRYLGLKNKLEKINILLINPTNTNINYKFSFMKKFYYTSTSHKLHQPELQTGYMCIGNKTVTLNIYVENIKNKYFVYPTNWNIDELALIPQNIIIDIPLFVHNNLKFGIVQHILQFYYKIDYWTDLPYYNDARELLKIKNSLDNRIADVHRNYAKISYFRELVSLLEKGFSIVGFYDTDYEITKKNFIEHYYNVFMNNIQQSVPKLIIYNNFTFEEFIEEILFDHITPGNAQKDMNECIIMKNKITDFMFYKYVEIGWYIKNVFLITAKSNKMCLFSNYSPEIITPIKCLYYNVQPTTDFEPILPKEKKNFGKKNKKNKWTK